MYYTISTGCVSIHAPVKGATKFFPWVIEFALVSIHAPVKGATGNKLTQIPHVSVSIHAPVKGATPYGRHQLNRCHRFNPRSREGSDMSIPSRIADHITFQSTLP